MSTTKPIRTEAAGYTWEIRDARTIDSETGQSNTRTFAYAYPIDPESGERLRFVTINRAEREASNVQLYEASYNGTKVYAANQNYRDGYTDSMIGKLAPALIAAAEVFRPRLSRAELIAEAHRCAREYMSMHLRQEIDRFYRRDIKTLAPLEQGEAEKAAEVALGAYLEASRRMFGDDATAAALSGAS